MIAGRQRNLGSVRLFSQLQTEAAFTSSFSGSLALEQSKLKPSLSKVVTYCYQRLRNDVTGRH